MSDILEIELRFNTDPSAKAAIDKISGAAKGAAAEVQKLKDYLDKVNGRGGGSGGGGGGASSTSAPGGGGSSSSTGTGGTATQAAQQAAQAATQAAKQQQAAAQATTQAAKAQQAAAQAATQAAKAQQAAAQATAQHGGGGGGGPGGGGGGGGSGQSAAARAAAKAAAQAARDAAKQAAADARDAEQRKQDHAQRNNKTWLALLAGRPLEAGITRMMPAGGGGAGANMAMAAAMAAMHVADVSKKTFANAMNTSITGGQADRAFVRDVGLGKAQDYYDTFSGQGEKMRKLHEEDAPILAIRRQGDFATGHAKLSHDIRRSDMSTDAMAAGMWRKFQPKNTLEGIDKTTGLGDIQYKQEERLLPLRQQAATAQAKIAAAKAQESEASGRLNRYDRDLVQLGKERVEVEKQINKVKGMSKTDRLEGYLTGNYVSSTELQAMTQRHEDIVGRIEGTTGLRNNAADAKFRAGAGLGNAEKELGNANNAMLQAKYQHLQEQESRRAGRVGHYGMAGIDGRIRMEAAAQIAKQVGFKNLPGEIIGQLEPGLGQKLSEQEEAKGGFPEMQRVQRLFPEHIEGDKNLTDLRKELATMPQKIEVDMRINEERWAGLVLEKFDKAYHGFIEKIEKIFQAKEAGVVIGLIQAKPN